MIDHFIVLKSRQARSLRYCFFEEQPPKMIIRWPNMTAAWSFLGSISSELYVLICFGIPVVMS